MAKYKLKSTNEIDAFVITGEVFTLDDGSEVPADNAAEIGDYMIANADGTKTHVAKADFEAQYEPA